MWESVWGEWGSVLGCKGGEGRCGKRYGGGVGKCGGDKERCVGMGVESVWGEWGSVLACGVGVWGVEREGVGKCVRVWGPNTLPQISSFTSLLTPFPTSSFTSPTPQHTFLHLLLYIFPHLPFLSPHPNTLSCTYPYISPHLLKVWQSYHVTKFLWRSYHVAKLLATM